MIAYESHHKVNHNLTFIQSVNWHSGLSYKKNLIYNLNDRTV
jgi:hypothetical protein